MLGCPKITTLGSYFPQAAHSLLIFLPNVMAELACPSYGKSIKNQHGLSLHISCWCTNRQSTLLMSSDNHLDSPAAVIASRSSIMMSPPLYQSLCQLP